MTNYREILRLHTLGLNKTEIAASLHCARNLGFVDSKTVQLQDLLVIGHVQTSFNELHLAMQIHYTGGDGPEERV